MIDAILSFLSNPILMPALCAWFLSQTIKVLTVLIRDKKLKLERFVGDGGMPSGHSATVSALAAMAGLVYGFSSFPFAVTFVFAVIVMHDATGVRRETGKQTSAIMLLFTAFNAGKKEKDKIGQNEHLKEFVGHSHIQVLVGALLGIAVAFLYIYIFQVPTAVPLSFVPLAN